MFEPSEGPREDPLLRLEALRRGRCRRAADAESGGYVGRGVAGGDAGPACGCASVAAATSGAVDGPAAVEGADLLEGPGVPGRPAVVVPPEPLDVPGVVGGPGAEGPVGVGAHEDPVLAALALVEGVIGEDPVGWLDPSVQERVVALARLVDRAKVAQTIAVGVWDARGLWCGNGFRGPCAWLAREGDLTFGEARSLCQTAKVVFDHAVVGEHLRSGSLRCRQVEQLAHAATVDRAALFARDVEVLAGEMARLSPYDGGRLVARWKQLADDELATADAVAQHGRRRLHHSPVGNGWKTDAQGGADDGAVIDAALRDASDAPDGPEAPEPRSAAQRRYDGLVKMCRHWLDHRNARCPSSPVVAVNLVIDEATLTGASASGSGAGFDVGARCDLVPGGPVARSTAQRLLCDSVVGRIVLGADGEPIDVGRTERLFTPAQRRAMIARDGPTCVVPYCAAPVTECEAHHLDPYEPGGLTDLCNGAFLCRGNHHDTHDRGYRLERGGVPGHYRWTAPDGRVWTTDRTHWGDHPLRQ